MFDLPKLLETHQEPDRDTLNRHYKTLFQEFDWRTHEDSKNLAREACWLYDDIITGKEKRWLSMLGQSGTGKTAWAKRIKKQLKADGYEVQLWDWSRVCNEFLGRGDYAILLHLKTMPILIIDEIGQKDWKTGNENLSHLLDQRLGKWTICISNLSQGDISRQIDTRIASRMGRDRNRVALISPDCPDYSNHLKNLQK